MDYITDILLVSLRVAPPVRLMPGILPTEMALRTVSEAIAKAACAVLELDPGEVQADFRAALTAGGQGGFEAEVYLYDTLPGGAGFARQAGERANAVLRSALQILSGCDCDTSCYKCLRSFKNKFEHDRLDRHIGADLLRYVLDDVLPQVSAMRTENAVVALAEDLARQGRGILSVERDVALTFPTVGTVTIPILVAGPAGHKRAICITHPLTAGSPADDRLAELAEFTPIVLDPIHELKVRRSLPRVTRDILAALGVAGG